MNLSPPRPPTISSASSRPDTARVPSSSPPTPASASGELSFPPRPQPLPPSTVSSIALRFSASPERASDSHVRSSAHPSKTTETHRRRALYWLAAGALRAHTLTPRPSIHIPKVIRPRTNYAVRNLALLSGPRPSNHNRRPPAMRVCPLLDLEGRRHHHERWVERPRRHRH